MQPDAKSFQLQLNHPGIYFIKATTDKTSLTTRLIVTD